MKSHFEQQLNVIDLGRMDYPAAWDLQKELAAARAGERIPDTLLVLEHPHTYTFGRSGGREHLLISKAECARRGVALYDVDRGGDVTYHGPGQLVGYPILHLPDHGLDYHAYLRSLEAVIIQAMASFGVAAAREPGYTGVWVRANAAHVETDKQMSSAAASGPSNPEQRPISSKEIPPARSPIRLCAKPSAAKIAAIGVKVDVRGITSHGFALNVNPDLRYFEWIVPCGIHDRDVTSLAEVLGQPVPRDEAARVLVAAFADIFGGSPAAEASAIATHD